MKIRTGKTSIIAAILAIATVLCVFAGCGEDKASVKDEKTAETVTEAKAVEIDIDAVAASIRDGVKFDDTLEKLEGDAVGYYYDLPEGASGIVYFGSGATAEEIAVFDGGDSAGGDALLEMVEKHVDEQIESFRNYVPGEVARLEKAVIIQNGRYVLLCVTHDADTAKSIMNEAVGK